MTRVLVALVALAAIPAPAQAPDLAAYDCTRIDDGKTTTGDALAAQGFVIASQARFGGVNLMLMEPRTKARANCFERQPHP